MSRRGDEWVKFAELVHDHIESYTVPQYGDAPDDRAADFTPEYCMTEAKKYCLRHFSGQRGRDDLMRDLFKLAHFACLCHAKETASEQ